jgi:nucleotide-binding universal stress UspA family protein
MWSPPGRPKRLAGKQIAGSRRRSRIIEVGVDVEKKIIEASSVAGGIAKESRDYDLVVLGAAQEPYIRQVMFGEIPEKVARYSPASVLVVKRYEGPVRGWLKRMLG